MADYQHVNEKAHESCKCWCGEVVTFRLKSKATATMCAQGHIVLRSSVEKQKEKK